MIDDFELNQRRDGPGVGVTIALIAGAVGLGLFAASRVAQARRRESTRTSLPPVPPPPGPGPSPEPSPGPGPGGITDADRNALADLGYGDSPAEILRFQRDYNDVADWYRYAFAPLIRRIGSTEHQQNLVEDGVFGLQTRAAIEVANQLVERGEVWSQLVAEAKGNRPQPNDIGLLEQLGYLASRADLRPIVDTTVYDVVEQFQRDFNMVNQALAAQGNDLLPLTLEQDGLFGPNTRQAAVAALDYQNQQATPWQQLVATS